MYNFLMRKITIIGVLITLLTVHTAYAAKVTPGSTCKKLASQKVYKGKIYTCIKLGKKLYWDNGVKYSTRPVAPNPVPSKVVPTPTPTPTPESTNIVAVWADTDQGPQLEIVWDAPALSNGFTLYLTGTPQGFSTTTVPFAYSLDKTKVQQKFIMSSRMIRDNFSGVLVTTFTGLLKTIYKDTSTAGATFTVPIYTDPLANASISDSSWRIAKVDRGFLVSWDAIATNGTYWETVVYKSSTINGTYTAVGSARNESVLIAEINTVYIKIRHRLITGSYSQYSNSK